MKDAGRRVSLRTDAPDEGCLSASRLAPPWSEDKQCHTRMTNSVGSLPICMHPRFAACGHHGCRPEMLDHTPHPPFGHLPRMKDAGRRDSTESGWPIQFAAVIVGRRLSRSSVGAVAQGWGCDVVPSPDAEPCAFDPLPVNARGFGPGASAETHRRNSRRDQCEAQGDRASVQSRHGSVVMDE